MTGDLIPRRFPTARLSKDLRLTWAALRQIQETNPGAIQECADFLMMTCAEFRTAVWDGLVRARPNGRLEFVLEVDL